tara:strand:- start:3696 stop:3890 length:195 start_codon:yes stop_codon:yes gene_type:complete
MEFEDYKMNVGNRFDLLPPEDKQQIIDLIQSPAGQIVVSLLGPELLGELQPPAPAPRRRGLAAR